MSVYEVIGIILVVVFVRILRINIKKKKGKSVLEGETNASFEKENPDIEADNFSDLPVRNLDSSHWTIELMNRVENEPDLKNISLPNDIKEVVNNIIALPHNYLEPGNKSMYQLVIESGYTEVHEQITKGVILDVLIEQPFRMNEWVQWSEDQRVLEGWFLREDKSTWQIGAFSALDGYKETLTSYPDLKGACAVFIKLQVEKTRKHVEEDNEEKKKRR